MSTDQPHPGLWDTLKSFLRALPPDSPPYCLIGALALGAWGRVRGTQDLDFLMLMNEDVIHRILGALAPFGFALDIEWADENPMAKNRMTRLRHAGYPVDLIAAQDTHDKEVLSRRTHVQIGDTSLWIATAEDLILLKLKASRELDLADARSIVHRQASNLDLSYLWSWADRLGLQGELQYILKTSPPP